MKPLLEIRNVSLSYHTVSGETKALSNISFNLMPSEFLAVVGPSGCGKSTLLNLICGMLLAEEGTILMNGIPPSSGDPRIGYMLQKDHLLEWRTRTCPPNPSFSYSLTNPSILRERCHWRRVSGGVIKATSL